ncbi:ammonium transporter [Rubidibacter lacunae]|nr:ammonium transporter [Rubidibacter lacunae]
MSGKSVTNGLFLNRARTWLPRVSPAWIACVPLAALLVAIVSTAAGAQSGDAPSLQELKATLDTIWVLLAAILVVFMNAGFAMLETGFCRQKNAVSLLSKNLIVFALATIAFWAVGFSLMFGSGGLMGLGGWFLTGEPSAYGLSPFPEGLPVAVFFLFQAAFAGTAATIVSGAVAERIKFGTFTIFSLLLVAFAYPIAGHWVWSSNAWLGDLGFSDFAGSTVVHSVGGWAALMGAAFLGPRTGKYRRDGRISGIPPHNMSIATLGALILWIGWFGFNPGSELAANENVPYIALTTNLAAAAGGITGTVTSRLRFGNPDLSMTINGILAGLVAITASCAGVGYFGAVIIGAIAGTLVVFSVEAFDSLHIDDPVGAISVHLVNGIWGTLAVGFFDLKTGLLFGGGLTQLGVQILGILSIGVFTVALCSIFWSVLRSVIGLRVDRHEEIQGLDIGEHAMEAYAGFVKEADRTESYLESAGE